MKSPTVMPIVTAIIAPPMSIPLPLAVIPPAYERPDWDQGIEPAPLSSKLSDRRVLTRAYRNEK